jgi:hypothetical protein
MPTGHEFSQEVKQLIFHVIDFVESEKNGPIIPLYNVKDRLVKMLNISERSVYRLTHELHHSRCTEIKKISQETEMGEKNKAETIVKSLRSRTIVYPTPKRLQHSTSNAPSKIFVVDILHLLSIHQQIISIILFLKHYFLRRKVISFLSE